MLSRPLTALENGRLLTQADVDALPDGCAIMVVWATGNGPHPYVLRVGATSRWAQGGKGHLVGYLDNVGRYDDQDKVFIP